MKNIPLYLVIARTNKGAKPFYVSAQNIVEATEKAQYVVTHDDSLIEVRDVKKSDIEIIET